MTRAARSYATTGEDGLADDSSLLALLPHPVFVVEVVGDDDFRFVYVNDAYRELLGDESATGDLRSVLPAHALVAHIRAFARAATDGRPVSFEADWGLSTSRRRIAVDVTPLEDEDGVCRELVGAAYEVTEHRRVEAELAHRTRHDPLTELPNRVMLVEWLHEALACCAPDKRVGLVLLDIDHFKIVNDSLGHSAGDELLTAAAARVARVLRAGDQLARLGGDELAIVCHDARRVEDVMTLARRVQAVFDEPFSLEAADEVFLGASVGVVVSEGTNDTPERLMRDADVTVFAAKELGRGRVELFDDTMRARAVKRLEVEGALRRAIVRAEFLVHYQPVVDLARSEVVGFEALVRWEHPEIGLIAPDEFLGVAEETGLIVPIGAWVLQEACAQAARWGAESTLDTPLTVSVNLSARQIADPGFVAMVDAALAATNLDPSLLLLEITENVLMEHRDLAIDVLTELGTRGVRVSIDDFGTGQSSLGCLKVLPVAMLKIDQSFVDAVGKDPNDAALVAAIVQLGHALGLSVTAEGVEDGAQLQTLRALGCDLGQGYYFARPQPGDVVRALATRRFRWSQKASA